MRPIKPSVASAARKRSISLTHAARIDAGTGANSRRSSARAVSSDAGAARGYRAKERSRGTIRFLAQLRRYTTLIAWLNPMPKHRWVGNSAEIIAHSVPMFQMDNDGLSNAIDVVRGQVLHSPYSASL
jgi:hypothetical protein